MLVRFKGSRHNRPLFNPPLGTVFAQTPRDMCGAVFCVFVVTPHVHQMYVSPRRQQQIRFLLRLLKNGTGKNDKGGKGIMVEANFFKHKKQLEGASENTYS